MKRRWILPVLLALFLLAACGKRTPADVRNVEDSGKLRIGVAESGVMCRKQEDGSLTGFDVEFARLVCRELKLEPEFVEIDWAARQKALEDGQVDCLWAGLSMTEAGAENMDFSDAYLLEALCLAMPVDAAAPESWTGKTVAVESGSAAEMLAEGRLPESVLLPCGGQNDALDAVTDGRAAAAVAPQSAVQDRAELTSLPLPGGEAQAQFAIGLRKGSGLTALLNGVIGRLTQDGTLATLAGTYGFSDRLIVG